MDLSSMPSALKRLVLTSIIYIVIALIAGSLAVSKDLPAQPMGEGSGTNRPVLQEFLIGNGTAISPGVPWLVLQVILTVLVIGHGRWSNPSVVLLGFQALLSGIFATTEPMFRQIFSPASFDPLLAVVEVGLVLVPLLMVVFAILEFLRRRGLASSAVTLSQ